MKAMGLAVGAENTWNAGKMLRLPTGSILRKSCLLYTSGHTRYRILKKHGFIKFEVEEIQLANKYEALASR